MGNPRPTPTPIEPVLKDLAAWFRVSSVPGIVIGGIASSLLGRPRTTGDVDALVILDEKEWERFVEEGRRSGFEPRVPDALDFARQARVLLLRHEESGIDVDISFGALPFEEACVSRAVDMEFGGIRIPLPTPEDLIIMKAVSGRARDHADIEGILDAQESLDIARVRRTVREFAGLLESPEMIDDLDKLLQRGGRG